MSANETISGRLIHETEDLTWAIREGWGISLIQPSKGLVPSLYFHQRYDIHPATGRPCSYNRDEVIKIRDAMTRWLGE